MTNKDDLIKRLRDGLWSIANFQLPVDYTGEPLKGMAQKILDGCEAGGDLQKELTRLREERDGLSADLDKVQTELDDCPSLADIHAMIEDAHSKGFEECREMAIAESARWYTGFNEFASRLRSLTPSSPNAVDHSKPQNSEVKS